MFSQINPVGGWKKFDVARPYVTTSGFAFDRKGRFPILFRGDGVRSAKNCWSLPSGLHEVGFTMAQQLATELGEECGLDADPGSAVHVTTYENIAPELREQPEAAQWHWVVHVLAIKVKTLDTFINTEPDKHPRFEIIEMDDLYKFKPWGVGLWKAIEDNFSAIASVRNGFVKYG